MTAHRHGALRGFVGRLERDNDGVLWAVLYAAPAEHTGTLLSREMVRSRRHGRRRVADLVLAEADAAATLAGPARRH